MAADPLAASITPSSPRPSPSSSLPLGGLPPAPRLRCRTPNRAGHPRTDTTTHDELDQGRPFSNDQGAEVDTLEGGRNLIMIGRVADAGAAPVDIHGWVRSDAEPP